MDGFGEKFLTETVELTLTVAELVDLIEAGAIAEHESGWDFPVVAELRRLFSEMVQSVNEAVEEI
jgi:hypothetical protein